MTRPHHRKVRSFVQRAGRTTAAQKGALLGGMMLALRDLLPRYGVPFQQSTVDLGLVFGRRAPMVLDIGFGDGLVTSP